MTLSYSTVLMLLPILSARSGISMIGINQNVWLNLSPEEQDRQREDEVSWQ
jgi:hypothetical protein